MPFSATTVTINQTLAWLTAFILNRPTTGVAGNANEPALTNANTIASTIVGPPFIWPWNRNTASQVLTAGTTDYPVALIDFCFLEKATIQIAGGDPPIIELEIATMLAVDGNQGQPFKIAVSNDDNAGNITFRLLPAPDKAYTLNLTYQKAPVIITALSQTWAPIPDKYRFLYERGMLAFGHAMYDSATYLQELQLFFRQLVGCSQGLDDTAKAIFLSDRLEQLRTEAAAQNGTTGTLKRGQ